jgi:hypothetical protein
MRHLAITLFVAFTLWFVDWSIRELKKDLQKWGERDD